MVYIKRVNYNLECPGRYKSSCDVATICLLYDKAYKRQVI